MLLIDSRTVLDIGGRLIGDGIRRRGQLDRRLFCRALERRDRKCCTGERA